MSKSIYEQAKSAITELCEKSNMKPGSLLVVGCSTSEVVGSKIGTNSSPDVAGAHRECGNQRYPAPPSPWDIEARHKDSYLPIGADRYC